jgi:mono/diheme cytochrome c family protein
MSTRRLLAACVALLVVGPYLSVQSLAAPPRSEGSQSTSGTSQAAATGLTGNLDRGRYLVEHVAMCIECHSTRDVSGVIIPGREYMGGNIPFRPPWPNDWAAVAPRNAGLPGYTDAAAMRLLMDGAIGRLGTRLRAPMPQFRMTPQDAADVIAFMRSR